MEINVIERRLVQQQLHNACLQQGTFPRLVYRVGGERTGPGRQETRGGMEDRRQGRMNGQRGDPFSAGK